MKTLRREFAHPSRVYVDLRGVRTKLLGKLNAVDMSVWLVNGTVIRDRIDIDFVAGGNPARYAYVPNDELWVERDLALGDLAPTILHEAVECALMQQDGLSYDDAHTYALEIERRMRQRRQAWASLDALAASAIELDRLLRRRVM